MSSGWSAITGFLCALVLSLTAGMTVRMTSGPNSNAAGTDESGAHPPNKPAKPGTARPETSENRGARLTQRVRSGDVAGWRAEVARWGEENPAAAWAHLWQTVSATWLAEHPDELLRIARHWADRDPDALKLALLELPRAFSPYSPHSLDPTPRLLVTLARVDPAAAIEVAQHLSGALTDQISPLLGDLTWEDPATASRLAAGLPPGEARNRSIRVVVDAWTGSDPNAALAFAQSQLDPRAYRSVVNDVLVGASKDDPAHVAPALASLPAGTFRAQWIDRLTTRWMTKDPDACAEWITRLPAGPDKERALRQAAMNLTEHDPQRSLDVARHMTSTTRQRDVVFLALSQLAKTDAAAAYAYAQQLPDEQTRRDALRLIQPPKGSADNPGVATEIKSPPLWEDASP